eukprot:3863635-Rhodomonas_salina.1
MRALADDRKRLKWGLTRQPQSANVPQMASFCPIRCVHRRSYLNSPSTNQRTESNMSGEPFISRTASAPAVNYAHLTPTETRLQSNFHDRLSEEEATREIIRHMKAVRADLSSTQESCRKTLETTSCCLKEHFQHIPPKELAQHIALRFTYFDKDKNGFLDRNEVTEAMAEMGQRPSETELEEYFQAIDKVSSSSYSSKSTTNRKCIRAVP